jgi:hypothetical protein
MQSDNSSPSPSHESPLSIAPNVPPIPEGFSITREDAICLAEYLEDFQEGDTDLRNTIIANVMAQLCVLRPDKELFNKVEASKVTVHMLIYRAAHS